MKSDAVTYLLPDSESAWEFILACNFAGLSAECLNLGKKEQPVRVGIRTWMDREVADRLSVGARVIDYEFAQD